MIAGFAEYDGMALAFPCDACGTPLRRDVVTLRFATLSLADPTAPAKLIPNTRQEYMVCDDCASYVRACVALLEARVGVRPVDARRAAS